MTGRKITINPLVTDVEFRLIAANKLISSLEDENTRLSNQTEATLTQVRCLRKFIRDQATIARALGRDQYAALLEEAANAST